MLIEPADPTASIDKTIKNKLSIVGTGNPKKYI